MDNGSPRGRSLEIIGRTVVSIREQCDAILCALADIQDDADRRAGHSEGMAAARHELSHERPQNPDAPAGAPVLPPSGNRVFNRGDIRTTPSGDRVIRPTFGKPNGEPLPPVEHSTEETTQ